MENLLYYAASITACALFCALLKIILPDGHLKKTFLLLLTIVCLFILIKPLHAILNFQSPSKENWHTIEPFYEDIEPIEIYENKICKVLKTALEEKQISVVKVEVEGKINKEHYYVLEKVHIYITEYNEKTKKQIQDILKEQYEIPNDLIKIYEAKQ